MWHRLGFLVFVALFCVWTPPVSAADAPVRVWNFHDGLLGWKPVNWERVEVTEHGLEGVSKFDCQLLSPKLGIQAEDYPEMVVGWRSDTNDSGETFFQAPDGRLQDDRKQRHRAVSSPQSRLQRIVLAGAPGWEGTIERLRFDPLNKAGATLRINFIALMPRTNMSPVNGGMEIVRDGCPLGWTGGPGKPRGSVSGDAHGGVLALAVRPGKWWDLDPVDLSLLGEWRIDGFAKGAKATRFAVQVTFLGRGGKKVGRTATEVRCDSSKWTAFQAPFTVPRKAYEARIRFTSRQQEVHLDDVYVSQVRKGEIVAAGPSGSQWEADWIWHPAALQRDHHTVYLRHTLALPAKPIRAARLQITADDGYALTVNGRKVGEKLNDMDGWRTPEVYELHKALKEGENLFEIEARDGTSAQGVIAEGFIVLDDGQEIPLRTGPDWEAALTPAGPWTDVAVIGRPPCLPWGALPTVDLVQPVPVFAFVGDLPRIMRNPLTLPLRLKLRLGAPCRRPVYVEATAWRDKDVVARAQPDDAVFAAGARSGERRELRWNLKLPYGLESCDLRVTYELRGGVFEGPEPTAWTQVVAPAKAREFPRAQIRCADGAVPRLFVNDAEVDVTQAFFIRPDALQQDNAQRVGVPILCVQLDDMGFTETGYDYAKIDQLLSQYLGSCPNAWIIANFTFDTRYQPWWIRAHPEARVRLEDGTDVIGDYHGGRRMVPSCSSTVWRDTYAEILRRLIRHLADGPFASRIIGFNPCSGITTEWFHWGAQSGELVDYSEAGQEDFRRWLARKYGDDRELQAAWHRPDITLKTASVPSDKRRRSPAHGLYFDPATQQDVLDYNRYQHDVVADTIAGLAAIIKKETAGRALVGTYYGYVTHLPETPGFCQGSGHFSLRKLLDCPDVDFMAAPLAYGWRELGETGATMSVAASFALNGKLWWNQEDLRTHWVYPARHGATRNLGETLAVLRREGGRNLAQGTAIQWYDFSKGWQFGDDRISDEIGRLIQLNAARSKAKEWPLADYLAVIVDEEQMGTFDPFRPPYGLNLIYRQREFLNRAGIPWKSYLLSDLLKHPRLLEHRAFLFLNLFKLNDRQRTFLREKVLTEGRTAAFVGPTGLLTPEGFSAEKASALLGWPMRETDERIVLTAEFADNLPAPWSGLADMSIGVSRAFPPILVPSGKSGMALAVFKGRSETAVVCERRQDHGIFWSAAPGLTPPVLRAFAEFANLSVVSRSDDALYVGCGFVGLHAQGDGQRVIDLPRPYAVRELFTGKTWPPGTRQITLDLQSGQTAILSTNKE